MRTTLTIDDDLAGLLQRKSKELDQPFKQVVNDALRKGLAVHSETDQPLVIVRPHDFGMRPGIDRDRMNQLVDELEVEDYLRKARRDDSARH